MELFKTDDFYIFVKSDYSLWWDRQTAALIPKTGWDITAAEDPVCLGLCDGIIGKVEYSPLFEPRLLLIKESDLVGKLHGENNVYKIKSVVFLPLNLENIDLSLRPCTKHKSLSLKRVNNTNLLFDMQKNTAFSKTWGTLKSAGNTIKSTTQQAAAMATGTTHKRDIRDKEKFEKQIVDEFYKIFTDTNSFYYSHSTDLTNSLQRLCHLEKHNLFDKNAWWKTVDDKFFWNKNMLKCFIEGENSLFNPWILPIIQGYIQIEDCKVELEPYVGENAENQFETFTLCILSRRSRFRAGTRYKRRGVDEEGEVANYVETEQIILYQSHEVSFVQVRGSVPVFWSQPGYKYRPPPRIDKGEDETCVAFEKHFNKEIHKYGPICILNLVDQSGKEKVIFDAYSNHVLKFNSPFLTYVTFDFHEYCRGMHFENVSILINAVADILKDMNYCWRDKQGHICSQNGVFRVNCMDCLDRTNVVQTALGKAVMEIQFCKLGLISPEGIIPDPIKNTFQLLWANNGDTISKQYAGTNALKGDYTRTGERKFTGIMKDGMNSANRYYINHFKDSVRQCCLDIMLGNKLIEVEVEDFWMYVRVCSCIASEYLPAEPPSLAPHLALQQEFEFANLLYHVFRYYLSRFKDTTRQGTIDIMLGNYVSDDIFNDSKTANFEEDNAATAEHVKLLLEDCKKMLINQPELVVGAWGLINADPSIGDPNETEMDTILILTQDSYFVADYDDQVDKVTKYQRVELKNVTLIEFGIHETSNALFKTSKTWYCIRINYKVNDMHGYYHMFRSTNLRFFNNMAVVIKNKEEEIESLKSICEAFLVAMDIAGLPPVHYVHGRAIDRRKSKILNEGTSNNSIYLDISGLPQMTRNVSETQLLALKSVGSKAISNMTQQFSKLNKIGNTFKQGKSKFNKANFTIGKRAKTDSSTDSEGEDYENSIFQPNASVDTGIEGFSSDHGIEHGLECTEDLHISPKDTFLPGVGIVMGNKNETTPEHEHSVTLEDKRNLLSRVDSAQLDQVKLASIMQSTCINNSNFNPTPEIQLNSEDIDSSENKAQPPTSLKLDKKFSHSSGEVDDPNTVTEYRPVDRSSSDYQMQLGMSQSQSESALKIKFGNIATPVTSTTKELFSPFSKLAKGVQNFGANLDPRKLSNQVRHITERDMEEHRRLQEKWVECKTRLIAM